MKTIKLKTYKQAMVAANEMAIKLTGKLNKFVFVKHGDGSKLELNNALVRKVQGWYFVFTEHLGIFAFTDDDITECYEQKENGSLKYWL